jgi:hypothetical protein
MTELRSAIRQVEVDFVRGEIRITMGRFLMGSDVDGNMHSVDLGNTTIITPVVQLAAHPVLPLAAIIDYPDTSAEIRALLEALRPFVRQIDRTMERVIGDVSGIALVSAIGGSDHGGYADTDTRVPKVDPIREEASERRRNADLAVERIEASHRQAEPDSPRSNFTLEQGDELT